MNLPVNDPTLLIAGGIVIAWLSRKSLRKPGSHGYYRFFAAQLLLFLVVLNRHSSGDQTIANSFLYTSAVLLILGFGALHRFGRASTARADEALLSFEKTTDLVTGGVFRFIRHPMYASLMALAWGFFFRDPALLAFTLAALVSFLLHLTGLADERECLAYFGQPYADYMRRTRRFVPFLF